MSDVKSNENTKNAGTKWTYEEDVKLLQEINDKKSYDDIALEHKRTIIGIKSRVVTNIIYPNYKDNIDIDFDEISEKYNIEREIISRYISKKMKNISKKMKNIDEDNTTKPEKPSKSKNKKILEYLERLETKIENINDKIDKFIYTYVNC